MTSDPHLPHPCLVADVGGTNARFAMVTEPDAPLSPLLRLQTSARGDFAETVADAIKTAGFPPPRTLVVAVAGPVQGKRAELTNAATPTGKLALGGPRLASRLNLDQGLLLNDFEALSIATPFLAPADVLEIGGSSPVTGGAVLVVGPGTGLGVGALLGTDGRLLPVASEGGHVGIGPETPAEWRLWPHLGAGRLSAEDLISGRGLHRIYRAIAARHGVEAILADPAAVTRAAVDGNDHQAQEAALLFLDLLARFAGDMALAFCAVGGTFIGGGVTPRLRALIDPGRFRERFEDKGPLAAYLRSIPVRLILSDAAALSGLAAVAARPQRFQLDYANRLWRS